MCSTASTGERVCRQAARALLDLGFTEWGMHRVTAMCNPENEQSWRLLERLGAQGRQFEKEYFFLSE